MKKLISSFCLGLVAAFSGTAHAQDPAVEGQWSGLYDTGIVSVHLVMMPNGKVITWEEGGVGRPLTDEIRLFDPVADQISMPALPPYDLFCSGHSVMPDGRVFVQGGHNEADAVGHARSAMYDPYTNEWIEGIPLMNAGRWYSTNTILPNGDVLVLNGAIDSYNNKNNLPQILDNQTKTWRNLVTAEDAAPMGFDFYPRMFVAPDGRVFKAGPDRTSWYLDTSGTGQWTQGPTMNWNGPNQGFRGYSSSVMYEEGKIMTAGGGEQPPTNTVEVIDLDAANPQWNYVAPMNYPRRHHNATILADGQILVTSGTTSAGFNNGAGAVTAAEVWNPETNVWTELSAGTAERVYHATAVLLPDARVMVAGGGRPQADGGVDNRDFEIFSPPYLFQGARPEIINAPEAVSFGETFDIEILNPEEITAVHFIRLGAATHAFNQTQGINRLTWSVTADGLSINAPVDPNRAQPGHYMLFVLDDGVPSVAAMIKFGDAEAPTVPAALASTGAAQTTVDLNWNASTDNVLVVSYNVYQDGVLVKNNIQGLNTTIEGLNSGTTYAFTVAAVDLSGNISAQSAPLNVATAEPGSNPPTANAGADQIVPVDGLFTVDGSASTDVDGQLLTYEWKLNDVVVSNAAAFDQQFAAVGTYVYELTVSDGNFTDTDEVVFTVANVAPNMLTNGDFSNGIIGWEQEIIEGSEGAIVADAGAAHIEITAPGTEIWSIQFYQPQPLVAGETYTLEFDARSDGTPRTFSVLIEHNGPPYTQYMGEVVTITAPANTDEHFSFTWEQPVDDADVKIGFYLGQNGVNDVWLDNVFLGTGAAGGNLPPYANAGQDQASYTGFDVTLDGSKSVDQDGGPTPLTYTWTQTAGPAVTLTNAGTDTPSFTAAATGTYSFSLTVNDGEYDSNTDSVTITVTDFVNTAPIANAGADQIVTVGALVNLDGSASNDLDELPAPLTYNWTQVTGPEITLSDNTAANPSFTADLVGSYTFTLTVNDGEDTSLVDMVTITAANQAPVTNLLTNGDFSDGLANWEEVVFAPAAGGPAVVDGELHFTVTATGDQDWNLQSFQVVGLDAGETYTLSFDARATALPRTVKVHVEHNGDPWTEYYSETFTIDAANTTQRITTQWVQAVTDAEVKIGFHFGNTNVNDAWLDNIVLSNGAGGGNTAPVANAGIDQAVLTGTEVTLDGSLSVDPNGDALTYNWIPASGPEAVNWTSPAGSATRSFVPATAGTYTFALQVNDGTVGSETDTVSIVVNDPNIPPVADAGANQVLPVGSVVTLDGSGSFDPDNGPGPLEYFWTQVSGPNAALSSLAEEQPTFTAVEVGVYSFSFVVYDGEEVSNIALLQIEIIPAGNQPPTADAGADQTVTAGDFVSLDGSASSDPEGDAITYTWTQTGGPAVTLADANTTAPNFTAPVSGSYVFSLTVNDGEFDSTADSIIVTAQEPNIAPIADAGVDKVVFLGDEVTLDGSQSSDPDFGPSAMTYQWSQTSGPSVTLSSLTAQMPTFTATELGAYEFTLFVFDGEVMSLADTVNITVDPVPNVAPVANAGADQSVIIGSDVTLDGSASSDSDDGPSPLTYSWTQLSGPIVTLDNANAVSPTFTPAGLGTYEFSLVVNDGELSSTDATLDGNKSFFVTDLAILQNFQIETVLQKILDDSFDNTKTPADLIIEMANLRTGCADFNGYPQEDSPSNPGFCSEPGANLDLFEAAADPSLSYYTPIALVNRFDLADKNGAHCGEYRIAYAGNNIVEPRVNFFIFEALLPNPQPELGAQGCRSVAEFWANLSSERSLAARSTALQDFYFNGVNGIAPAITADHFRGVENGSGKIRLNARVDQTTNWVFMEFHTQVAEACAPSCSMDMVQATIKDTPFPALAGDNEALSADFQDAVLAAIEVEGEGLLADTITGLSINLPDQFNVGRQHANATATPGVIEEMSPAFAAAIQNKLSTVGSDLTPQNIITRVHTLSCAGCHNQHSDELGGPLNLDSSTQLVEFLSMNQETGPDGQRFELKPAIVNTFIPERMAVLQNFLDDSTVTINVTAEPDADADGVADANDNCANTPAGETVDANGCSASQIDSDGDGVMDNVDICGNTPVGETADAVGCSPSQLDTDNDGVNDALDTCANTPAGETADANGCSDSQKDSDNDGVNDATDTCADTPAGATVDANGCPTDSDADGVFDGIDQCAATPAGATVNAVGCPADQDADGVFDGIDQCANTPAGATVDSDGCPSDSDNDGVFDGIDLCPGTPAGATVDANGCDSSPYDLVTIQAETMATNNGFLLEDTTDEGLGENIGWTDAGDYAIYDIPALPEAGVYQFSVRHAGAGAEGTITISSADGTVEYGTILNIGGTGGWQTWETETADITLPAGITQFRMTANAGALNFNWYTIVSDYDNDDVVGSADLCEGTPAGEVVDANGCADSQLDADNDGVTGAADLCPATPAGETVDANGCAESEKDDDADGVMNDADACPTTAPGATVDASGCELADSDNDGVYDINDSCANTPVGDIADVNGCGQTQLDDDNDGVSNADDACINTPAGEAVDANGCAASQVDTDNDGVADSADTCADTPAGELVDANGCADSQKDSDNDGVSDADDQCANTPTGETADAVGCSSSQVDTDADGVADNADNCPGTVSGVIVDANGCGIDSDNDGVFNGLDLCPGTPVGETADVNGCSESQTDADNDGVMDGADLCADTPVGETADANGCSDSQKDSDNDGVNDAADNCADTPTGEAVDANGCSTSQTDADGDGVMDNVDLCGDTPAGETADALGCSPSQLDDDNDGVSNADDLCADTPEGTVVDATGCEQTSTEIARIEAEDYVAATDTTAGNAGAPTQCVYNGLDVDVENTLDDATCNVGWTAAGETLDYTVGAAGGVYDVTLRLAGAGANEIVELLVNGVSAGTVSSLGGGWQDWNDYIIQDVTIPTGATLQVVFQTGGVNFNYMDFTLDSGDTGGGDAVNLLSSDGTIPAQGDFGVYLDPAAGGAITFAGEVNMQVGVAQADAWKVQLTHDVAITAATEYTICFDAYAEAARGLIVNVDQGGTPGYASLIPAGDLNAALTATSQTFVFTFTANATDATSRLTFNAGLDAADVTIDNIGIYEGNACGTP